MRFDSGDDVFFDSLDILSCQGSVDVSTESLASDLWFKIWLNELQSVRERRESFLHEIGFADLATLHEQKIVSYHETMKTENSETVTSCSSFLVGTTVESVNNGRVLNSQANCSIEDNTPSPAHDVMENKKLDLNLDKNKSRKWWRGLKNKGEKTRSTKDISKENRIVKVRRNKKRNVELSGVCLGQELFAHRGLIWSIKFSPDGQFLASGGQDGVICIWRVNMVHTSAKTLYGQGVSRSGKDRLNCPKIVIPEEIFHLQESPLQQFYGHTGDVLDLAWSKSNFLLSASKDKTVRLWRVGCNECLHVFQHNDYVTCVQFNPCDETYFLSGCIDGKVRKWGVYERRVIDWAEIRDVITAICYQPDGKGFIVGSVTGTCSFFDASDGNFMLNARVHFRGGKRSSRNKIAGIQFTQEDSPRVIVSSEDSKIRVLEGTEVIKKYKGPGRSGTQMSASITPSGRHIISVGEDSCVYMWNYDEFLMLSSKKTHSSRSCERFFSKGVSVAIPWSGMETRLITTEVSSTQRDLAYFSLANCFSMDTSFRSSATWPEEKLPPFEDKFFLETWGLVIVTAGRDGVIRTFHNYGLPISI